MAGQCAAEGVDHPGYLLRLSELEMIDRHHRMVDRRIKAARFPATKSLDTFDFLAMPSVNKHLVMQLARCEYVDRRENVIAIGNSGTGKTHVALGLGLAACQRGLSVGSTTAASLVHELIEARDERRLLNLQAGSVKGHAVLLTRAFNVKIAERIKGMDPEDLAAGQIPAALKTLFELEFKALGYEDRVALTGKGGGPVKTEHVFQPTPELWDEAVRIRTEFERLRDGDTDEETSSDSL